MVKQEKSAHGQCYMHRDAGDPSFGEKDVSFRFMLIISD